MVEQEQEHLLKIEVAADETAKDLKQPVYAVAESFADPGVEREWDGHLLQCCGKRDRHGFAAFASTVLCLPRTLGLNTRAVGRNKWSKSLIIFILLAFAFGALWINEIGHAVHICGPDGPRPHPHGPNPHPEHGLPHDPKLDALREKPELPKPVDQIFLGGATLDPMLNPEPGMPEEVAPKDGPGFTIMLNGQEVDIHDFEATNEQIQLAKNQALEGMTQISLGRKLLHKHDHDDDDHEHKPDEKPKHGKKKCKHNKDKKRKDEDDDDSDDDNDKPGMKAETFDDRRELEPMHHHPEPRHPRPEDEPITPGCLDAKIALVTYEVLFYVSLAMAMVSGYKLRMQMREKYNIKGSPSRDYFAWFFCLPCAVCQETRTLTKNNVQNGVWYGPTQLIHQVPTQQIMFETPQKPVEV